MANIFSDQNIQNFHLAAQKRDFARKNLFRILYIDTGISTINFDASDYVYITTTSLPKRAIKNLELPFMGLNFNIPGTANYPGSGAWSVTFRMPQDLSIRKKLEAWTRAVFDDATSTGQYGMPTGNIEMALMDKAGKPIRNYLLKGAYCVTLGEYGLDMTDSGSVVEQEATIAYQYWDAFDVAK
jgi:hypothetical protein